MAQQETTPKYDLVGKMMDYEAGNMSEEDMIAFFQYLIDTGIVYQLQGSYGRMAQRLVDVGKCSVKGGE